MVKNVRNFSKPAFTFIELIFAIVIIAISVLSLPMISQVTADAMEKNIAQEAIFSALSEINIATAHTWDGGSLLDNNDSDLTRVINYGGACSDSGEDDSLLKDIMRRSGHVNRRCLNSLTSVTSITNDSLDINEHNYTTTMDDNNSAADTSATGYKKSYTSRLDVERCDSGNCIDFGDANNINMKEIKVTIRDTSTNDDVTVLRTYSANIGEVEYHKEPL